MHSALSGSATESEHITAAAVGIESVIFRIDCDIAAAHVDDQRLNSFIALIDQDLAVLDIYKLIGVDTVVSGCNCNGAAGNRDIPGRVDSISYGCNIDRAGLDIHISFFYFVGCDNAVVAGINSYLCLLDTDAVIGVDRIRSRCYCDRAASDDKVIVGGYSMSVLCGHRKASAAVNSKIIVCKYCAVCSILQSCVGISAAAGQSIHTVLRQCQEDLLRLIDSDTCVIAAIDIDSVQKDPDLGGIVRVHGDLAVAQ